ALDPLMLALAQIRTRPETVAALADLDDTRALPTLLRWLPNDPYVPVRARMTSLVAQLGRASPAEARAVLTELAGVEHEARVMAALLPALRALGSPAVVELGRGRPRTLAGGELWLVGQGSGGLEVSAGGLTTKTSMVDGVAHVATERAGVASVRTVSGGATVKLAFSRPAP